ncbi:MAG: hypothetical protein IKK40_09225, partial [Bacteroidales bacterium]|nr:hypothetical protein [Bacteroidales bacterium]
DEEFPDFKPDLRFDLEKGSKLTDLVSSGVNVPGFMINERVKNIFEQCKLPEHRYYEATVTDHKGVAHPYYYLHIMPNDYSIIDFDKTIFKKTEEPMKIWPELAFQNVEEIKNAPEIRIKNVAEMKKYEDEFFPNLYVILDVLRIHDCEKYDMLYFPDVDVNTKYISEKLADMLKSEKITGIGLYPCDDIENLE